MKIDESLKPSPSTFAGLFFLSLTTLMFEILLTRLFSATMFYHFTFVVLSLAMFGLSIGATLVYVLPKRFPEEQTPNQLSFFAWLFGLSATASMIFYLRALPLLLERTTSSSVTAVVLFSYLIYSIPFICAGVCICLALTRFRSQTGPLYAADLLGAACACLLVIAMLFTVDGPSAVLINSAISAGSAWLFAIAAKSKKLSILSMTTCLVFTLMSGFNLSSFSSNKPYLGLEQMMPKLLYQKWTPMSLVTVQPADDTCWGWSIDPKLVEGASAPHKNLLMDRWAGTPLYQFAGDFSKMNFLRFDISNVVHSIRPDGSIYIIGIGGGRDILASLMFGHKTIVGAEFNSAIIKVLKEHFGDYIGHLDRYPSVQMVNEEARSYLTGSGRKFDVVQASLIDTFAATAGGGLALTENSLYTADGWKLFISHLTDNGVLSFTYPYSTEDPALAYRMCCMACQALEGNGITDLRKHLVVVGTTETFPNQVWPHSEATVLVGKSPFTQEELDKVEQSVKRTHHKVILSPTVCIDSGFLSIIDKNQRDEFVRNYWADISAPTDDHPFFLCLSKISDYLKLPDGKTASKSNEKNIPSLLNPLPLLFALLLAVAVLTAIGIVLPVTTRLDADEKKEAIPLFFFFSSIGLGFMFIEISQLTRLSIFLGHPVFGLSVVLFTLLISSGLGSLTVSSQIKERDWIRLLLVPISLACVGPVTALIASTGAGQPLLVRVLLSIVVLSIPGFFMGMALPLGMLCANQRVPRLSPWLWGMNGATSVLGSIIATVISVGFGVQATFWCGVACYLICLASFFAINRQKSATAAV